MNGIWIRSSDGKALLLCTEFVIEPEKIVRPGLRLEKTGRSHITADGRCVGVYTDERRAVEVLDEIESFRDGLSAVCQPIAVFRMPKE